MTGLTAKRLARFWSRVDKSGPGGCWLWTSYATRLGHGRFYFDGKHHYAHRVSWLIAYGTWPERVLDHLCRVPACVNPAHLEDVPMEVNTLRGFGPTATNARMTHCKRGHEFTPENTYVWHRQRHCRTCVRLRRLGRAA